jgi:acyl transferase domain-containing protein
LEPITSNLAAPDGRWVTSISSYGIGGANAHVVVESLESATEDPGTRIIASSESATPSLRLFFIAAHTESAMLRWRASLATFYKDTTDDRILRSLSYDLARQSRSYAVRSFTVGPTISSENRFSETVVTSLKVNPKLCLVFSGQGPQHIAMGRELCASYPVFLATIKQSDEILVKKFGKESFLERTGLFVPNTQAKLSAYNAWPVEDVVYSIVFIQLALVDLIKNLGIEFSYVVGHRYVHFS